MFIDSIPFVLCHSRVLLLYLQRIQLSISTHFSKNCHAERYEEYKERHGASAMCFDSQIMGVQCFPKHKYHGFHMEAVMSKKALICVAQVFY